MPNTVDLAITSVVLTSPLTAGNDLDLTINFDVDVRDGDGAVDAVNPAVEDITFDIYYLGAAVDPADADEFATAIAGATKVTTVATDADVEFGDGAASLEATVAWADLLAQVEDLDSLSGKIFAVVSGQELVDGLVVEAIDPADAEDDFAGAALTVDTAELEVTAASLETGTPVGVGDDIDVDFSVANNGEADADDVTVSLVWEDTDGNNDVVVATETFDLNGGASRNGNFDVDYATVLAEVQDHSNDGRLYVEIDRDDDVLEVLDSGENNTSSTMDLSWVNSGGLPDLLAENLRFEGDGALEYGEDLVVRVGIGNDDDIGGGTATDAELILTGEDIDGDTYEITRLALGDLELGASDYNYKFMVDFDTIVDNAATAGDIDLSDVLSITATIQANEADIDGSNNTTEAVEITVDTTEPEADLKINEMTVRGYDSDAGQKTVENGDDLHIKLKVENEGTADFAAATTTYYLSDDTTFGDADDVVIGTDSHGVLDAGEADNYEPTTIDWDVLEALMDGGSVYDDETFYLFADINAAEVDESDFSDNDTGATPIKIVLEGEDTPAALSISFDFRDGDDTVSPNEPIYLDATIQNTGEEDARRVTTKYYFTDVAGEDDAGHDEDNILIGTDSNGRLSGGETDADEGIRVKYNDFDTDADLAGFVYAVLYIDGVEHTRTDAAGKAITVDAPSPASLAYDDFSIDGGNTLALGEKITVSMTVENTGETRSDSVKTKLFWSADGTYDDGVDVLIDSEGHGSINGGVSKTETESFKFADLAANGDGQLLAVLFDSDDVATGAVSAIDFDFAGGATAAEAEFSVDAITPDVTADTLAKGDKLVVDYTVSNSGLLSGTGVTTFYWSDTATLADGTNVELGSDKNHTLKAGEVDDDEVFKISYDNLLDALDAEGFDVDPGDTDLTGFLIAKIDDSDDAGNTDEASVALDIELYDGATLSLDNETFNLTSIDDEDQLIFTFDAVNSGDLDVKARTKFYWSTDGDADTGDDTYLELDGHGTVSAGGSKEQSESFSYSQLVSANGGTGDGHIVAVIEETDSGALGETYVSAAITLEVLV